MKTGIAEYNKSYKTYGQERLVHYQSDGKGRD